MADKQLIRIPLNRIKENPVALRAVNRASEIYLGFLQSVTKNGVMNPIVVRELPTDGSGEQYYGLIEGLHRYTASLDAGHKDIPAHVMNMDDGAVLEAQLIGNAHRIETTPVEYSKHLQRILAGNPLLTLAQLADKLSRSATWLSDRLGILKLTESIHGLVDSGAINLANAYALAKLPHDEQLAFVDRAQTMNPAEFTPTVLQRKKEIDTAKRQGRDPAAAGFTAVPHLQKLADLKAEMENAQVGPILCNECELKTAAEGFAMGVKWALHLDPRSVEAAKVKDAERKKKLQEQNAKAAAERAKKRADDAAAAAARLTAGSPT